MARHPTATTLSIPPAGLLADRAASFPGGGETAGSTGTLVPQKSQYLTPALSSTPHSTQRLAEPPPTPPGGFTASPADPPTRGGAPIQSAVQSYALRQERTLCGTVEEMMPLMAATSEEL